jgi:hypothetical protein
VFQSLAKEGGRCPTLRDRAVYINNAVSCLPERPRLNSSKKNCKSCPRMRLKVNTLLLFLTGAIIWPLLMHYLLPLVAVRVILSRKLSLSLSPSFLQPIDAMNQLYRHPVGSFTSNSYAHQTQMISGSEKIGERRNFKNKEKLEEPGNPSAFVLLQSPHPKQSSFSSSRKGERHPIPATNPNFRFSFLDLFRRGRYVFVRLNFSRGFLSHS